MRFEIYSTDESGSLNFGLKFGDQHDLSQGLVPVFGWVNSGEPISRDRNYSPDCGCAMFLSVAAPIESGLSSNLLVEQVKFLGIFTGLPSPDSVLCKLYAEHVNRRLLLGIWGFEGIGSPKNWY